jgi:hypothetical protein
MSPEEKFTCSSCGDEHSGEPIHRPASGRKPAEER